MDMEKKALDKLTKAMTKLIKRGETESESKQSNREKESKETGG